MSSSWAMVMLSPSGNVRDVLAHRVVEGQPAFLDELQDDRRRHRLGDAADAAVVLRRDRLGAAELGRAEGERGVAETGPSARPRSPTAPWSARPPPRARLAGRLRTGAVPSPSTWLPSSSSSSVTAARWTCSGSRATTSRTTQPRGRRSARRHVVRPRCDGWSWLLSPWPGIRRLWRRIVLPRVRSARVHDATRWRTCRTDTTARSITFSTHRMLRP